MPETLKRKELLDLGEIFRSFQAEGGFEHLHLSYNEQRTVRALSICRTAELGGHVDACNQCGEIQVSYNSCRNRHCPKCQHMKREKWILDREKDLLPIKYHHMVFTIPHELNALFLQNKKILYDALFQSVSKTIMGVAARKKFLGAKPGIISILHTWGQTLTEHPHIHCIVTGGGLSDDERWIEKDGDFFLPVRVLSRLFRGKLLHSIRRLYENEELEFHGKLQSLKSKSSFSNLLSGLYNKEWVVFCKEPFRRPEHLIQYLGRYTHRIAISNHRILDVDDRSVTFSYKDYAKNNEIRSMRLEKGEFIRRFLLHVLPGGFVKIRYYGIFANRVRNNFISMIKLELKNKMKLLIKRITVIESWKDVYRLVVGKDPDICPVCMVGRLVTVDVMAGFARPP